jgi:P4 family phage/plasmid primase-like protien
MAAPHPLGPLAALAECRQWIIALRVPLQDGRTDKIPCDPRTGAVGINAHDPQHWTDYGVAARNAAAWGEQFRPGFVLTQGCGWVCVDIDNALQSDGTWSATAHELHKALPGAVGEISQSGHGLHLWARCSNVPPHAKKRTDLHAECYSSDRFIMAGAVWPEQPPPADECTALPAFLAYYFPPREAGGAAVLDAGPAPEWSGPTDDDSLIALALRSASAAATFGDGVSFGDLWHGNADALGRRWPSPGRPYDASSADMALAVRLAFFTGRDQARVDRLMRRSALVRDKFERADYLPRTIAAACSLQREVYRGGAGAAAPSAGVGEQQPEAPYRRSLPGEPLHEARAMVAREYIHAEGSTLKAWQGSLYRWGGASWRELTESDVRAAVYAFIDRHGSTDFRPNQTNVTKLLDALRHCEEVHVESTHSAPCWLHGVPLAPAAELVACANGLLHLPSRSLLPASPRFFNLNAVPFAYEPAAPAPVQWLRFLADVWPNDPEAVSTLQEVFGYLLTPDTSQQKLFLIVGPKRSGKGTIARVLTEMLGAANVAGPTLASLATTFGLAPLMGKLAAIVSDARLSGRTDQQAVAENLLRISGEDRVEVERKFLASVTIKLGARFVLLTNELPRIADSSGAMASRFVILTMQQSFLGREDAGLTSRLLTELPGVLAWAVDGWHRLKARGHFLEPRSSAVAAQELADLGSPVAAFVRDCCTIGPAAEVEVGTLFAAWRTWCAAQGIERPGPANVFGRDLRAAFPSLGMAQARNGGTRARVYRGIGLAGTHWHAFQPIAAHTPSIAT